MSELTPQERLEALLAEIACNQVAMMKRRDPQHFRQRIIDTRKLMQELGV